VNVEAPYAMRAHVINKPKGVEAMYDFEKFMYAGFEKNRKEILEGVTLEVSKAYDRILIALGENYVEVMETIEAHQSDKALQGYERGFKDGIRFMMSMATS
jgi:hypothetical protein